MGWNFEKKNTKAFNVLRWHCAINLVARKHKQTHTKKTYTNCLEDYFYSFRLEWFKSVKMLICNRALIAFAYVLIAFFRLCINSRTPKTHRGISHFQQFHSFYAVNCGACDDGYFLGTFFVNGLKIVFLFGIIKNIWEKKMQSNFKEYLLTAALVNLTKDYSRIMR